MVIPYSGALSWFLGLFSLLPASIKSFVVVSIVLIAGIALLRFLSNL